MAEQLFRIAFRKEGEFVNAYLAQPHTMDDAIFIASVKTTALSQTPGAFEDYQALIQKIVGEGMRAMGVTHDGWIAGPAPENERTGNA